IYDQEFGLLTAGRNVKAAKVAYDIAMHTADIVDAADRASGYKSLDEAETFDIEYWSLEQAKLGKSGRLPLEGEVAVVTGAASGIGRESAAAMLSAGAVVVGVDIKADIEHMFSGDNWLGIVGDVSDSDVLDGVFASAVREFGGVDILV